MEKTKEEGIGKDLRIKEVGYTGITINIDTSFPKEFKGSFLDITISPKDKNAFQKNNKAITFQYMEETIEVTYEQLFHLLKQGLDRLKRR